MSDGIGSRLPRRDLLRAGIASSVSGLAGCSKSTDSNETPAGRSESDDSNETGTSADVPTNPTLDVGATYEFAPQFCVPGGPAGGEYEEVSPAIMDRHVDRLQRSGVSRVVVTVDSSERIERAIQFSKRTTGQNVTVQFRHQFLEWLEEGVSLTEQLEHLREGIQRLPSYETINGRPVVLLADLESITFQEMALWDELLSSFADVEALVDFVRVELAADDVAPFLIGQTTKVKEGWASPRLHDPAQLQALLERLDGVQNGVAKPIVAARTEDTSDSLEAGWEELFKRQLRTLRLFAEKHGLEFVPQVVPGLINSNRGCPPDEQLPRSPSRFESLLRYASRYSTSGRVTVHSFNDWTLGSQIEPGSMMDTEYGESYLDVLRDAVKQRPLFIPGDRDVYHVREDGADWNTGSRTEPLATVQEGLLRAGPGETVQVHSGTYQEEIWTVRDGKLDEPITITGPEDATLHPPESGDALWIKNSHVRLTGLTVDGLLDPGNPDDVDSYSNGSLITTRPPDDSTDYLEDIVCAPAGIGNSMRSLMVFQRTKRLEIGPLRIVGLAGAEYVVGDKESHVGEFVYLGQPPRVIEGREHPEYNWERYPWKGELDRTRHVHVHHIDNSDGHPHSQLVNTKTGTRDVLVEYCTDGGGSFNTEPWNKCAAVRFQSYDATLRWCVLRDGDEHGVQIGDPHRKWLRERSDPEISPETSGTGHSIFGNTIENFGEKALHIDTTAEEQDVLCGNDVTGPADGDLERACPRDIPGGDGRGHLGGDSPWSET